MVARRGVSLIEVLVSAVLLAIGIGGTMHALLASARLRVEADRREAMVGLLLDRLSWFEAFACAGGDTVGVTRLADGSAAHWRVDAVGASRVLTLDGARAPDQPGLPAHLITSRSCP